MNNNENIGARTFKARLVTSVRDGVLRIVNDPSLMASFDGIPKAELGTIVDLKDHERQILAMVIARTIDQGIESLLYGLDDEPEGIQILYNGEVLNKDGDYNLSDASNPLLEHSHFDKNGHPKGN